MFSLYLAGFLPGHVGVSQVISYDERRGNTVEIRAKKALEYLLKLEKEAEDDKPIDASILIAIGSKYESGSGCERSTVKAMAYYKKAAALKDTEAYDRICQLWFKGWGTNRPNNEQRILTLVEAIKDGQLGRDGDDDDDYLLVSLVNDISNNSIFCVIPPHVYHPFKSQQEMILHYLAMLTQGKSYQGYHSAGTLYWNGCERHSVPKDQKKALEIWLEADKLGIADSITYSTRIVGCYMYVLFT